MHFQGSFHSDFTGYLNLRIVLGVLVVASVNNNEALDRGSPMSHVEFKKWLCQLSLYLKMVSCRMSN